MVVGDTISSSFVISNDLVRLVVYMNVLKVHHNVLGIAEECTNFLQWHRFCLWDDNGDPYDRNGCDADEDL